MEKLHDLNFILPVLVGAFWGIVMLQSGLDKVFDWGGNLSWLKSHFEKTPLGSMVKPMVGIIAFIESLAGILSLVGIIIYLVSGNIFWIIQGLLLSIIVLLMLIFGQRIAKDYDGAKTIAIYFGVALASALVLL
ncbi:MAG: DoxX family protein [Saprospiraceae bacterium]